MKHLNKSFLIAFSLSLTLLSCQDPSEISTSKSVTINDPVSSDGNAIATKFSAEAICGKRTFSMKNSDDGSSFIIKNFKDVVIKQSCHIKVWIDKSTRTNHEFAWLAHTKDGEECGLAYVSEKFAISTDIYDSDVPSIDLKFYKTFKLKQTSSTDESLLGTEYTPCST